MGGEGEGRGRVWVKRSERWVSYEKLVKMRKEKGEGMSYRWYEENEKGWEEEEGGRRKEVGEGEKGGERRGKRGWRGLWLGLEGGRRRGGRGRCFQRDLLIILISMGSIIVVIG